MQLHEQRVIYEKRELDEKIIKLSAFISSSPLFRGLPQIDQSLLRDQRETMILYSDILSVRIGRFIL